MSAISRWLYSDRSRDFITYQILNFRLGSRMIRQILVDLPQGLKPFVFAPFSARLKSCPERKQDCMAIWRYGASSLGSVAPPGLEMCCVCFPRTASADADLSWAMICRPFGAGFVARAQPGRGTTARCTLHASWVGNAGGQLTQSGTHQRARIATGCGHLSQVNSLQVSDRMNSFFSGSSFPTLSPEKRRKDGARRWYKINRPET